MYEQILEVITGPDVIALVGLMAGNIVLSIAAALVKGVFTFRKVGDFVKTRIGPLVAYLVVAIFADFAPFWAPIAIGAEAALFLMYAAGVLAALKSLGFKNLPDILTEK